MRRIRRAYREFELPSERTNAAQDAGKFTVLKISEEMAAFDRLPQAVQMWLNEGPRKYSAVQIESLINAGETIEMGTFGSYRKRANSKSFNFLDALWE